MPNAAKITQGVDWRPVPATDLAQPRYKRIVIVRAFQNGALRSTGLGWVANDARVATVAHVLSGDQFKADKCELTWLAGAVSTSVVWKAAKCYISNGMRLKGSGSDIAHIQVNVAPPPLSNPLPLRGTLEFVRWRDGALHRAYSAFDEVPPFLGHWAVTEPGDSGGPVFMGDQVVGMVLGNAALSRSHLLKPDQPFNAPSSALLITSKILEFLRPD